MASTTFQITNIGIQTSTWSTVITVDLIRKQRMRRSNNISLSTWNPNSFHSTKVVNTHTVHSRTPRLFTLYVTYLVLRHTRSLGQNNSQTGFLLRGFFPQNDKIFAYNTLCKEYTNSNRMFQVLNRCYARISLLTDIFSEQFCYIEDVLIVIPMFT